MSSLLHRKDRHHVIKIFLSVFSISLIKQMGRHVIVFNAIGYGNKSSYIRYIVISAEQCGVCMNVNQIFISL